MKRKIGHHEREAWIMAAILPFIIVVGVIAGLIVRWLR